MASAASHPSATTTHDSSSPNDNNNNKLYKGVRKRKWGKWVCEIRLPNSRERIWLGSYDSPEKAARAFDAALYCLRGRHAHFNFPDTPFKLENNNNVVVVGAGDKSLTHQEIQEIASKFANEDPPPSSSLQRDDNDGNISAATTITTATTIVSSSCSTNICEYDGMQVDQVGDMSKMDWTFLDMLDNDYYSNQVPSCSDYYGLYSDLDKVHSGELGYSTLLPSPFEGNEQQMEGDYDPFSHQSFLWNW
ncbi:hypothetical protein RIF29_12485 [Crotalaria pallida]|uniref:AP2/ERF domain-containing protein n=1 Tax=Crotalaria pallida TaxID=3830 RepID=A0AAN9INC2_CROPI